MGNTATQNENKDVTGEVFKCCRCHIVFDISAGVVITECDHTFCKKCINHLLILNHKGLFKCLCAETKYKRCQEIVMGTTIKEFYNINDYFSHITGSVPAEEKIFEDIPSPQSGQLTKDNLNSTRLHEESSSNKYEVSKDRNEQSTNNERDVFLGNEISIRNKYFVYTGQNDQSTNDEHYSTRDHVESTSKNEQSTNDLLCSIQGNEDSSRNKYFVSIGRNEKSTNDEHDYARDNVESTTEKYFVSTSKNEQSTNDLLCSTQGNEESTRNKNYVSSQNEQSTKDEFRRDSTHYSQVLKYEELEEPMSRDSKNYQDATKCRNPECKVWWFYGEKQYSKNFFTCPDCKQRNCFLCKGMHNPAAINCAEYKKTLENTSEHSEDLLKKMLEDNEAMLCPTCKEALLKDDGCDFITCYWCKVELCWVTRGYRWGVWGPGDTSGGCRCNVDGEKCHPQCRGCH